MSEIRPALEGRSNQQRLDDIWWDTAGPGQIIPKYDTAGAEAGRTTIATEASWLPANFALVRGQLDAVLEAVRQLAEGQGAQLDVAAIEAAAERGAEKALAENVVRVDVNVKGEPSHG